MAELSLRRNAYTAVHSHEHHAQDWERYELPAARLHHAHLHDSGVAEGLGVSGTLGGTSVTVEPGVAVDGRGQLIQLVDLADVGGDPPHGIHMETPAPVTLSVSELAGQRVYVTVQHSEILRSDASSSGGWLEQVPWVRLQAVDTYVDDGLGVVLAVAEVQANDGTPQAGMLVSLQAADAGLEQRRRLLGTAVEEVRLRRAQAAGGQVEQAQAARLAAVDGGVQLSMAEATSRVELLREGGGRFAALAVEANVTQLQGNLQVTGDAEVRGSLQVTGTSALTSTFGGDLRVGGVASSSALQVTGDAEVQGNLQVRGIVNAADIQMNGQPLRTSQWDDVAEGVSYAQGNVGIGTAIPEGKLDVRGDIRAGNSDIYFTKTDHNHTGFGNTTGFAAVENAANYGALMILGRAGMPKGRTVKLWDYLQVNGDLDVTGRINGQLGGLDVAPNFTAAIRCADLLIGGVADRGPARRAMVAWANQLEVNYGRDWPTCIVNGFVAGSSRDHKDNIERMDLTDARHRLQSLSPVEFSARSDEEGRRLCGFIAEETPAMLSSTGQKGIYLDGILAVLTKVVQAQEKELDQLRAQVASLSGQTA